MVRRTVLAAVLLGLVAGSIVALAVPQTRPAPSIAAPAAGPAVMPAAADVRRIGRPRPQPRDLGYVRLRRTGPIRIDARTDDPRGGPDWAVRSFLAERLALGGLRGRGRARVIGRNRCVQLGRLHRGRFGWLTADGTFRPARITLTGVPTHCGSRRQDAGRRPHAEAVTTITEPTRPAALPLQTVVWGSVGSSGRAELTVRGRPSGVDTGPGGGVLAVLPPDVSGRDVSLVAHYRDRRPIPVLPRETPRGGGPPGIPRPASGAVPALAAQAPDPDGGLPFGLLVTRADGGLCTSAGARVVGDRAGSIDYALDLLREDGAGGGSCGPLPSRRGAARMPDGRTPPPYTLSSTYGGGLGAELGEDPASGRVARRTLRGRVTIAGVADPSVATLTFASPSDVRTIAPSGPHHAFIVVYGGAFASGSIVITTTFKDGRARRDVFPASVG